MPPPITQRVAAFISNQTSTIRLVSPAMVLGIDGKRRFAPLQPDSKSSDAPKLRGVVFDVDGTLCLPQTYMFAEMRSVLGIPKTTDILDHIYGLPIADQPAAMESIRAIERAAMAGQMPQPGLVALMEYLDSRKIRKGICTRNFDAPVAHLLSKFLPGSVFGPVVTRDFRPPKPDPAGILHIAERWGLVTEAADGISKTPDASGLIMVGDSMDDMAAGRRAGAATVLLSNDVNQHLVNHDDTDLVISRLDDLIDVLEQGFQSRDLTEVGDV